MLKIDSVGERRIKNVGNLAICAAFICCVFSFAILFFVVEKHDFSALENRELAALPSIWDGKSVNRGYYAQLDTYYTDAFPFRNNFLSANRQIQRLYTAVAIPSEDDDFVYIAGGPADNMGFAGALNKDADDFQTGDFRPGEILIDGTQSGDAGAGGLRPGEIRPDDDAWGGEDSGAPGEGGERDGGDGGSGDGRSGGGGNNKNGGGNANASDGDNGGKNAGGGGKTNASDGDNGDKKAGGGNANAGDGDNGVNIAGGGAPGRNNPAGDGTPGGNNPAGDSTALKYIHDGDLPADAPYGNGDRTDGQGLNPAANNAAGRAVNNEASSAENRAGNGAAAPASGQSGDSAAGRSTNPAGGGAANPAGNAAPGSAGAEQSGDAEADAAYEANESTGVSIVSGQAFEMFIFSEKRTLAYAEAVNAIAERCGVPAYVVMPPSASELFLPAKYRDKKNEQKPALKLLSSSLRNAAFVDSYDVYDKEKNNYVYFRTDHHWTADGAYLAYREFAKAAGFTPVAKNDLKGGRLDGFLGSLYRQIYKDRHSALLEQEPDFVNYYEPNYETTVVNYKDADMLEGIPGAVLKPDGELGTNLYNVFFGGDMRLLYMHSGVANGKSIIAVRDSYGHAFLPYLANNYEHVYAIEPRYFKSFPLAKFISDHDIQELLFINHSLLATGKYWMSWIPELEKMV